MFKSMLPFILPLVAAIGFGAKKFSRFGFVPENCVGIVERFGKVVRYRSTPRRTRLDRWLFDAERAGQPKLRTPGYNWRNIPFVDKTHHVQLAEDGKRLEDQLVNAKEEMFFFATAAVRWIIVDPYRVSYGVTSFESLLQQRCESTLMSVVSGLTAAEFLDKGLVNAKLLEEIRRMGDDLGVNWLEFSITSARPTDDTGKILQMERRTKAIAKAAVHLDGVDATAAMIASGNTIVAMPDRRIGSSEPVRESSDNVVAISQAT